MPPHYQALVSIQLFFIDSWSGEILYVRADDNIIYQDSHVVGCCGFSNVCGLETETDKTIFITASPFSHTASTLTLNITTNLDEAGDKESFGFNSIFIILDLCDSPCLTCYGMTNDTCTSCNSGYFLEGTTCDSTCPQGKYGNTTTNTCERMRLNIISLN